MKPEGQDMKQEILIESGHHTRKECPVRVAWPYGETPRALESRGASVPVQRDGDALLFLPRPLDAGEQATYTALDESGAGGVTLQDDGESIRVELDEQEFTTYHYAGVPARPYFWPVLAPGGVPVTRAYPMRKDVPGEKHDHPHHRSMYVAYGSANGADNWSEEAGHGFTVHRSIDELVSGPVFGHLRTASDWTDPDGMPILVQRLSATFWSTGTSPGLDVSSSGEGSAARLMDVEVELVAAYGDVAFGDTKEGGILTVRVASEMDVPRGGRIENAFGGIDEGECWGRAAHWCHYRGTVDGRPAGIAVMDHPDSFRYPTYWHVRDYGLMAANPFALGDYTGGRKNGSHLLEEGESLLFRYRVVLHAGSTEAADIRGRYLDFVSPPEVKVREV
jgi:hypothetical protein